ncbi:MAG TPA: AmmeMemoRadiSam system protein B [Actinomycetota bacterium]
MRSRTTGGVRATVAAGTFYPSNPDELTAMVDELLDGASTVAGGSVPHAIVVPHAGYVYSGPIAASGYATIRPAANRFRRVALFGPAHFVPLDGAAVPEAGAWRTPLGDVGLDPELRRVALDAGAVADDASHAPEHALEVQLPFLLRVAGPDVGILPVALGRVASGAAADLIEAVGEIADLVIVSTDLSHYHDQETARRLDRRTADAILARDPGAIGPEDACGVFALRGMVELARRRALGVRLLDLRTSADTAGDPSRVVGYGAFAIGS